MIAVDAMGGDNAPEQIVQGALLAAKAQVPITLFGQEKRIISILESFDSSWRQHNISIYDAPEVIGMAEEPVGAIRKKRNSSIVQAIKSIVGKENSAIVSAGNSGAIMVAATFILGREKGVSRPAIVGELPIRSGKVLCLDIGANTDCKPENLLQFAYLGNQYAKKIFNLNSPRIALLSNGCEEGKGSLLVKQAFALLTKADFNFVGNIEPAGIFKNKTDVVVCDGFAGNVLLKTIEAVQQAFNLKSGAIENGGALLAGVNGTVVISHGNADAQAIQNAILFAFKNSIKEKVTHGTFKESVSSLAT